jgi:hypothetical protein
MLGIDVGALLAAGESSRDYVLDRAGLLPRWAVDGVGAIG